MGLQRSMDRITETHRHVVRLYLSTSGSTAGNIPWGHFHSSSKGSFVDQKGRICRRPCLPGRIGKSFGRKRREPSASSYFSSHIRFQIGVIDTCFALYGTVCGMVYSMLCWHALDVVCLCKCITPAKHTMYHTTHRTIQHETCVNDPCMKPD